LYNFFGHELDLDLVPSFRKQIFWIISPVIQVT
jgi:hypothetical protein